MDQTEVVSDKIVKAKNKNRNLNKAIIFAFFLVDP